MEQCGIYGIWFEKELMYIGKTIRPFRRRFMEHKSNMKYQGAELYRGMRAFKAQIGGRIICKPIESFNIGSISNNDLELLEKKYIQQLNPRLNIKRG